MLERRHILLLKGKIMAILCILSGRDGVYIFSGDCLNGAGYLFLPF